MSKSGLVCLTPDDGSNDVWIIVHPSFPAPALVSFHKVMGSLQLMWHNNECRKTMVDYDVDFLLEKWLAFKEANK